MTASRRAFTLVELLIVIVVIGVLAAIAIPKFGRSKQRAQQTVMIADLRSLVTAEVTYFQDSSSYADFATLSAANRYRVSAGVIPPTIQTGAGYWFATVTHTQLSGVVCGIAFATANPVQPGAPEGDPVCK